MKILISNITDSGILRNRMELITQFLSDGHSVIVVSPPGKSYSKLVDAGCEFIPISIDAHGLNPFKDLLVIKRYKKILKRIKPDIVLTFTIKPNLYCGFNCRMLSIPQVMNITGFGNALAYPGIRQKILIFMYRIAAKRVKMIFFQNQYNLDKFRDWRIASENQYYLLPGSGVNLASFSPLPYPLENNGIHFLFISRILKEKGIDNYLEAARVIKKRHPNAFFHVLGNTTGHYDKILEKANEEGVIIYHGRVDNVADFQRISHCTILPSYYPEGISNVLLEAASSGRPVITCDHPGCKEAVDDGKTGYLVLTNNTTDLINKIELFLSLPNSRKAEMGRLGRIKMEQEFDRKIVLQAYLNVLL